MQTVINSKRFLICDDDGNVRDPAHGFFAHDVRYLSQFVILLDGEALAALGEPNGNHLYREFDHIPRLADSDSELRATREFMVDDALNVRITIDNAGSRDVQPKLEVQFAADFNDMFEVKRIAFTAKGMDPGNAAEQIAEAHSDHRFRLDGRAGVATGEHGHRAMVRWSQEPTEAGDPGRFVWKPVIDGGTQWVLELRIGPYEPDDHAGDAPVDFDGRFARCTGELSEWLQATPSIPSGSESVRRVWQESVNDLATLRIVRPDGDLVAAGCPWFMAVFGRDSLITSMQTLALGAGRARAPLAYLARSQSLSDNPAADAEIGKILHEEREGDIAAKGYATYYGSIDSTPLFLLLLDDYHRWTGDDEFVVRQRDTAMRSLEWVMQHGDFDSDGYLEYERRSEFGLENQSWKDSWDSQRFSNGEYAEGAIAPVEVQAYGWAARHAMARLASDVWNEEELARELRASADELRTRFLRDFWVEPNVAPGDPRSGGYFAMALDGNKRLVDALTSNIGHVLWTGILDGERATQTARQLVSPALNSGFGVRTMSSLDAAYDPSSYHVGSVWPHDTAICIAGLARCGFLDEASQLGEGLFAAAVAHGGALPEVFAGFSREDSGGKPVPYATTCSPQAWAAGAPVMVLTALLGIEPDPVERRLVTREARVAPWLDGLSIDGIPAFGKRWSVSVSDGEAQVESSRDFASV
jgi:glycogen debranching enzyme